MTRAALETSEELRLRAALQLVLNVVYRRAHELITTSSACEKERGEGWVPREGTIDEDARGTAVYLLRLIRQIEAEGVGPSEPQARWLVDLVHERRRL